MNPNKIDLRSLEKLFKLFQKPMKRKKRVLIVRHGQSEGNVKSIFYGAHDYPLTSLGILQAKLLSPLFAKYLHLFDGIITSNLIRAVQTCSSVLSLSPEAQLTNVSKLGIFSKSNLFGNPENKTVNWDNPGYRYAKDHLTVDYLPNPSKETFEQIGISKDIREFVVIEDRKEMSEHVDTPNSASKCYFIIIYLYITQNNRIHAYI